MRWKPTSVTWTTVAAAIVITLIVAFTPLISFTYKNARLHLVLETAEGMVALLVALLVIGRSRERQTLPNLLLAYSLGVFGLTNLMLSVLPDVLFEPGNTTQTWAAVTTRTLATAAFSAAALVPRRHSVARRYQDRRFVWLLVVGTLLLIASGFRAFAGSLPAAVQTLPTAGSTPRIEAHAVLLGMQLLSMVLYLFAAYGFTRRAEKTRDRMMLWFGAGCVLAAFARLHYFLAPSLYTNYVYVGDLLRLGFYVALLIGAATEIESYWESRSEAIALEDRRRLARELHDGLAQELVFVAGQVTRLERGDEAAKAEATRLLARSSHRAVAEARRAISSLVDPMDRPLAESLRQVFDEMAVPSSTTLDLDLDPSLQLSPRTAEALIRIAREGVQNALQHARASRISVRLKAEQPTCLSVVDDGVGISGDSVKSAGFGIITMKERAQSIGGTFELKARPGGGTQLEVVLHD